MKNVKKLCYTLKSALHLIVKYESIIGKEAATIRNFRIVQTEGSRQVTRDTKHYNLQMIIAVGFKVNDERAVQFRKWANL